MGRTNALLVHNPAAGYRGATRRRAIDECRRALSAAGLDVDLVETRAPGEAESFARDAQREQRDLLIACGGDGTLNEIVNGLLAGPDRCQVSLGLLPAGTANILAKELGVPRNLPAATARLIAGAPWRIAVGLATPLDAPSRRRYFLSVAGAGFDGQIVHTVDLRLKKRLGVAAYWWQGAWEIARYTFPRFRITSGARVRRGSFIVVGRTAHYGGPFRFTTRASLFEERFEVMAVAAPNGLACLAYLPAAWCGTLRGKPGVEFWQTDAVRCDAEDVPVFAQVDGEPLAALPVEFTIVPAALDLWIPAASGVDSRP